MLQIIKVGLQAPNIAVQSRKAFVRKIFVYTIIIMKVMRIIVLKTHIIGLVEINKPRPWRCFLRQGASLHFVSLHPGV